MAGANAAPARPARKRGLTNLAPRRRAGLTLIEVIVALGILGGVLLGLGMFSVRLSQSASAAFSRYPGGAFTSTAFGSAPAPLTSLRRFEI